MIAPLPGLTPLLPGSATRPLPGIAADVVDEQGKSVGPTGAGYAVLTRPWPGMLRGIWGDDERYKKTYWSKFPHVYFAGDGCRRDADGNYWFHGPHRRRDEYQRPPHFYHRGSKGALVDHPRVAEAAVCGRSDETTGQAIYAFVTLRGGDSGTEELAGRFARSRCQQAWKVHAPEIRHVLRRNFRKRAAEKSCGACCAISPRAVRSATRRRWRIPTSYTRYKNEQKMKPPARISVRQSHRRMRRVRRDVRCVGPAAAH